MKKLLSLTIMAMFALVTPTLSAATTTNNTTTKVKKSNTTQNVDYSKMNYEQLEKIVKDARFDDMNKFGALATDLTFNHKIPTSEETYKKILNIYQKVIEKRASLAAEIDKRKEKYDKNHENIKEVYMLYFRLSQDIHYVENIIKQCINTYENKLKEANLKKRY